MELFLINILLLSILGGCLGSFASTLIYRLPLKDPAINIFKPRSFCPQCKSSLTIFQLIPFISYLSNKGACKVCSKKIQPDYIINEIFFALFLISIYQMMQLTDITTFIIIFVVFILYIQALIDFNTMLLSQPLSILLIVAGLILNIYFEFFTVPIDAFLGLIFGYGMLFVINHVYKMIKSTDGIGSGDFMLLGGIGSIFGASAIGPILLIGSSITLCVYLLSSTKNKELPLGFGLSLGAIFYCLMFIYIYLRSN